MAKRRNYPPVTLDRALEIPQAIQEGASGMPVSRLTLSELVGRSPNASQFRDLLLASRAYGLTQGGVNADNFQLTPLGQEATNSDGALRQAALQKAVLNVEPFRAFLRSYSSKKVPSPAAFRDFLVKNAAVVAERSEECMTYVLADARQVGFIRKLPSGEYIELQGNSQTPDHATTVETETLAETEYVGEESVDGQSNGSSGIAEMPADESGRAEQGIETSLPRPKKVFIAHGKDKKPLTQLKKMLDQFKVEYAVAVDEPHGGRPISAKVANLMREECTSAIFIFTADEHFLRPVEGKDPKDIWRPSENLVYELGAASVLYDRRIVIFKDKRVTFPSDYSDLGYIEFETDQFGAEMGNLFNELVALDILEVRVKG